MLMSVETAEAPAGPVVPSSLSGLYMELRLAGKDHEDASAGAARSYGRKPKEVAEQLDRARRSFEAEPEIAQPENVPDMPERDAFAEAERDVRQRVSVLTADRSRLALDALTDPAARAHLTAVESELEDAEGELDRLGLARDEATRRDAVQAATSEHQERDAAMRRASELQAQRQKAAARVDVAMRDLARALSEHQGIAMEQAAALSTLDVPWSGVMSPDWTISGALAFALTAESAPAAGLLDGPVRDPRPLADTDRRPVAAIENSKTPKGK